MYRQYKQQTHVICDLQQNYMQLTVPHFHVLQYCAVDVLQIVLQMCVLRPSYSIHGLTPPFYIFTYNGHTPFEILFHDVPAVGYGCVLSCGYFEVGPQLSRVCKMQCQRMYISVYVVQMGTVRPSHRKLLGLHAV